MYVAVDDIGPYSALDILTVPVAKLMSGAGNVKVEPVLPDILPIGTVMLPTDSAVMPERPEPLTVIVVPT